MAIIRQSVLDALFTSANAAFQKGKPTAPSDFEKIATIITSDSTSETYHWLGEFPDLRKWVGDRVLNDMAASGYVIKNETYESSVAVSADSIADDKFSVYAPLFTELGIKASIFPNEYVFPLLNEGFTRECFDGKAFFAKDHPTGKNGADKVSNVDIPTKPEDEKTPWFVLDTSSSLKPLIYQLRQAPTFVQMQYELEKSNRLIYGFKARFNVGFGFWQRAYASKQELTAENLMKVLTAMKSLKNNEGKPLGIKPTLLVVPPSLEWTAKQLLEAPMVMATSNPLYNALPDGFLATTWLA